MKRTLLVFFTLAAILASCRKGHDSWTVIISLDGNRWDYPEKYDMPFFDSLATVGVKARMEPSYPASTFPNHYTMATGCVPDHNGLVNNSFRDPYQGGHYSMGDTAKRYSPKYYLCEPIWITAQRQGVKTGNVYWVGSDIPHEGEYPTYWRRWDDQPHWTFEERCDEMVRLMSLPESERPRLLMGYFDEPDHTGHECGPHSPEVAEMVHYMDSLMHSLFLRLKATPAGDRLNFILVSDHGMTDISPERFVSWAEALNPDWVEDIVGTTPTSIFAKEGCVDSIVAAVSQIPHLSVWKHGEVPAEFNYGTSDRLGDVIVAPDLGWQFAHKPKKHPGAHGYSPKELDMQTAFRAVGPDFKVGYEPGPYAPGEKAAFINIDLYPMLCYLLDVKPAPVDGKLSRIKSILK